MGPSIRRYIRFYTLLAIPMAIYGVSLQRRTGHCIQTEVSSINLDILSSPEVGIVDDLLSVEDVLNMDPSVTLNVTWYVAPNHVYQLTGSNREFFNTSWAQNQPQVSWQVQRNTRYSLLCVDLDYPMGRNDTSNPQGLQFLHWLANGITNPREIESSIVKYLSPRIPEKSRNTHRYVFILLRENDNTPGYPKTLRNGIADNGEVYIDRKNFNVTAFRKDNNVSVVAVNYFLASY